jgi:hypothetical protein
MRKKKEIREINCPICDCDLLVNFNKVEINQGGKNDICPACQMAIWIPIRGDPEPVPLLLSKPDPSGLSETEL